MSDQQGATIAPPPAKRYRYRQDQIPSTEQLYLEGKYPDVHFSFRSNDGTVTRVPAHKSLLAVASDVFARMFYGELKETGDVTITDASEAAFKEFLQFFYLSEVDLTAENVASVMDLGNKYNVKNCIEKCVRLLIDDLKNENVCIALSLAILYDQKQLIKICQDHILLNTEDVFKTGAFLECNKEVLAHILDMKLLSCSEVDVFEACMAWVQAKSKHGTLSKAMVKEHLGDLYYKIRFPSMTMQEFCDLEAKYSEVLRDDFHTITTLIVQSVKTSDQFNTSPRDAEWNVDAIKECRRGSFYEKKKWYALDIEEKTTFSISSTVPLLLGSFQCNKIQFCESNLRDLRSHLSVEVQITESRELDELDAKVLVNLKASLDSNMPTISLPHPILVRPKYFYTICIKRFPDDHHFHSERQNICFGVNFLVFHNKKVVGGQVVSLIRSLQFNHI